MMIRNRLRLWLALFLFDAGTLLKWLASVLHKDNKDKRIFLLWSDRVHRRSLIDCFNRNYRDGCFEPDKTETQESDSDDSDN